MNIHNLKKYNYYMVDLEEGSKATYMYTAENVPEGKYCIQVRGILKNNDVHTVIAGAIYYTGNKNDIVSTNFNQYSNIIVITVNEKVVFSEPTSSFFKILNYQASWFPLKLPPDSY